MQERVVTQNRQDGFPVAPGSIEPSKGIFFVAAQRIGFSDLERRLIGVCFDQLTQCRIGLNAVFANLPRQCNGFILPNAKVTLLASM